MTMRSFQSKPFLETRYDKLLLDEMKNTKIYVGILGYVCGCSLNSLVSTYTRAKPDVQRREAPISTPSSSM